MDQISLFDLILEPGQYVTKVGPEIQFNEIVKRVGKIIILDKSTKSHKWYQAVLVEKVIWNRESRCRRLIYYHGKKQRGLIDELYFFWGEVKAYLPVQED